MSGFARQAIGGGPVAVLLVVWCVAAGPPERSGAENEGVPPSPAEPFVPSTAGKKLLHYRGPGYDYMFNQTEEMEQIAFDGLILGGAMPFFHKIEGDKLHEWAEKMAKVPFRRYADNFYLCYSATGDEDKDFDWFHDFDWIVDNWRTIAAVAKKGGFKGICFDSEYYAGRPLFGYYKMKYREETSFEAYQAQARKRGAEIMRAINESFPDVTILYLFGYSGSFYGVPQHPVSSAQNYTLVSAFVDGMLSECGPEARIVDQHEQSFSFRVPGSYARARAIMTDIAPEKSHDPGTYRRHHRAGFSFWADCWENAGEGRPFDVDVLENNYYTPAEFAYSLHHALSYSDGYVWMWPGVINWWQKTAKTRDVKGNEVVRPLPEAYVEALELAHAPSVPEPPRDRKPNLYRILPATTQEGWGDKPTFGDLWDEYEQVCNLPLVWRFRTDPDEVGVEEGWFHPAMDDSDWMRLHIREFWELQGYSPYDGCAWYRVGFLAPKLPDGRKLYLAFGGVADEAWVYVNGELRHRSRFGDNIRHERFLVDVTEDLESEKGSLIAVRVWNTGWCGGIWKNVKLIAAKP